jgi:chorismate dehydratase
MRRTTTDQAMTDRPLRIGAVSYLNTVPLIAALPELLPTAEFSLDHPSRLADDLAAGRLDVALAPCIEAARHPDWTILSTACISCRGPVLSVKLFFRTEASAVRTLALDEGSRTSVALAQILLAQRCGVRPKLRTLPLGVDPSQCDADAVLVIGDRAIRSTRGVFRAEWDLGREWCESTGLPFVFAVWAARPGVPGWAVEPALDAARDQGRRDLERIADQQSAAMNLPRDVVIQYLRDHLNFVLGERERRGLEMFCRRAIELDLLAPQSQIVFDDCPAQR